jgi:hypothetical protein
VVPKPAGCSNKAGGLAGGGVAYSSKQTDRWAGHVICVAALGLQGMERGQGSAAPPACKPPFAARP